MTINTQQVVSEILATEQAQPETSPAKSVLRTHTVGNLQLVIIPKTDREVGHYIKWRKNCTVEGTLYFVNPEHEVDRPSRKIFSMQSKDVKTLMRCIFPKAWEILYDYAVILGDKNFQQTYLAHRIKIHARWVDKHAKAFAEHGRERDRSCVLHNATVEKKLKKRLEALTAS